ncbi:Protein of uncharacterised function (DUF2910) [Mycobacteroides abscessus subsp. abscessus]|nr:Protein of uncharacterised function (DUF2910) [Mycobacteroides abscessus subsp. abscessus]SIE41413.1 Protein of uncharacterised function (DUF2910) [Mycobacteroides abscessus subsp. abscessus]SKN63508.1 Protein of uncharacterised function (DUF2910) [Mycobacteroides abscessus subsp. abscessus]
MWRELLGLAFLMSLNPVLLGLILVVISRPRPVQNLLAFWVGALVVNVPSFVIALFALHMVPSFASFAKNLATADPRFVHQASSTRHRRALCRHSRVDSDTAPVPPA